MDTEPAPRLDALLRAARTRIDPREAELLLAQALDKPHGWLFAHGDASIDAQVVQRFDALLARRAAGEPVAYLVGHRSFWTLDLMVTPDTLIPRPETELLVELALARIPRDADLRVADLGTGTGAIALAIAQERPRARVCATDQSHAALGVARGNARASAVGNIEFHHGDWWTPLAGERFELVASNPPYIAGDDPHLVQGDLRFEPALALVSGEDGLDAIRTIIGGAGAHLVAGGWLLLEHGLQQGEAVRRLLSVAGFDEIATSQDLEARDRVTLGRRPAEG